MLALAGMIRAHPHHGWHSTRDLRVEQLSSLNLFRNRHQLISNMSMILKFQLIQHKEDSLFSRSQRMSHHHLLSRFTQLLQQPR